MRQTLPTDYQYDESIAHPITFKNQDGNVVEISIVTSNIIRVRHLVGGIGGAGAEQQRTEEGGGTFSVKQADGTMEIQTPSVRVVIELPTLRLVWYDVNDPTTPFAEDLKQRAYAYDKHGDIHWHYRRKYSDDLYYGLGERTGNLNLAGRRFRLERLDSMGYDAETQDPLYKFCPYYVTLSHTTRRAHGIFYQNLGATTVDFGQEFDAVSLAFWCRLHLFIVETDTFCKIKKRCGEHTHITRQKLDPWITLSFMAPLYLKLSETLEQSLEDRDICLRATHLATSHLLWPMPKQTMPRNS